MNQIYSYFQKSDFFLMKFDMKVLCNAIFINRKFLCISLQNESDHDKLNSNT